MAGVDRLADGAGDVRERDEGVGERVGVDALKRTAEVNDDGLALEFS